MASPTKVTMTNKITKALTTDVTIHSVQVVGALF